MAKKKEYNEELFKGMLEEMGSELKDTYTKQELFEVVAYMVNETYKIAVYDMVANALK